MKKLLIFIMIACYCRLQGQFVDFKESVSDDKFLGIGMSACSTQTDHSKNNYQKGYDCGNSTISQLLNVNLLSPQLLGQQVYVFNNFMYYMSSHNDMGQWNGKDAKDAAHQAAANARPDQVYSSGVFMIVLGTSSYLQQIVALSGNLPTTCPTGKTLLVAQLKYNNGSSLHVWSQDAICIAPTDSFTITVSSDVDSRLMTAGSTASSNAQGIDWMQDAGPTANYQEATKSPRKVRLIVQSQPVQSVAKVTPVKK